MNKTAELIANMYVIYCNADAFSAGSELAPAHAEQFTMITDAARASLCRFAGRELSRKELIEFGEMAMRGVVKEYSTV
jgi:hypothetical protein